ncbi:MAG: hypothetical protein J6C53_04050 [Clostridia bacterium]|nr:hypothetical protein [Clostridia bacterium]
MNFYLLIPLSIIIIFFIPIKLQGRFSFNVAEMSGAIGIFFYRIKLSHQLIWFENKKIYTRKEDEIISKELEFNSKEMIFMQMLFGEIKDKTRLKEISIFYNLGVEDAFTSAMLGGTINVLLMSMLGVIKNAKPTATLGIYDTISYNRQVCQFAVKAVMSISLFDVVYSLFRSVILTKRATNQKGAK